MEGMKLLDRDGGKRLRRLLLLAGLVTGSGPGIAVPDQASEPPAAVSHRILLPWKTLSGGVFAGELRGGQAGAGRRTQQLFLFPSAAAAIGNDVYIVDSGQRRVVRFDLGLDQFFSFPRVRVDPGVTLAAGRDGTVYVLDPLSRRVTRFTRNGAVVQTFQDEGNLGSPVGLVVDRATGLVYLADAQFDRIAGFTPLGPRAYVIVPRDRSGDPIRGISAMALGPDGFYLVERVKRRVVVVGKDGGMLYAFGEESLLDPGAITVDRFNRVYVADQQDNTLKIFAGQKLVEKLSGPGPGALGWRIGHLSLDEGWLYVTDTLNQRIEILRVMPPGKGR